MFLQRKSSIKGQLALMAGNFAERLGRRRAPPLLTALLAQLSALVLTFLLVFLLAAYGNQDVPAIAMALAQGVIAMGISWLLGMKAWWLPIQLLFVPGLVAGLSLDIAPGWYLLAFLTLLAVYWSVFRSQVPLYLSSRAAWRAVAGLLPDKPGLQVIDLGSGLGGLLGFLGRTRPQGHYVGMEAAPLPFVLGWLRGAAGPCDMRFGSFWKHDLSGYDVAYAYLSPVPMGELWDKVKAEMLPGSLFISNTFAVPGVKPSRTVRVDDFHASILYIYRL